MEKPVVATEQDIIEKIRRLDESGSTGTAPLWCLGPTSLTNLCNVAFASGRQADHDDTYFCILDLDADTVSFPRHGGQTSI